MLTPSSSCRYPSTKKTVAPQCDKRTKGPQQETKVGRMLRQLQFQLELRAIFSFRERQISHRIPGTNAGSGLTSMQSSGLRRVPLTQEGSILWQNHILEKFEFSRVISPPAAGPCARGNSCPSHRTAPS